MSLRQAVARQHGFDEDMAAKIDRFESSDLSERHKAALRLADAMVTQPGSIDAALGDELRRHFDDEGILEITLDMMKWSYQKVSVALGTDAEVTPGRLTTYEFDETGHTHFFGPDGT